MTGRSVESFSIICLSPQEWEVDLPTNRQQIMRRAASAGHEVLFVETGEFLGRHLKRMTNKRARGSIVRRLLASEPVADGVRVCKAVNILPWGQRFAVSDRVNGWLSARRTQWAARGLPTPRVTWLYDPRATWAVGACDDELAVYDCVDDYAEQASGRRNRVRMAAADRRAAERSQLVFATTQALRDRHLAINPSTHLVPNVGDFAHFSPAADRALTRGDCARLERPVLGFAGNLAVGKIDIALLNRLAEGPGTLLLAGPVDDELEPAVTALARRDNVVWLGLVPYADLPGVVAAFDVGLIPYASNDYTRNVFPLKLYEYLAAGKAVAASGVPEVRGLEPDVVVAESHDAFVHAIEGLLALNGTEDVRRRQSIAAANTWDHRAARLLALVGEALAA